MTRLQEPDITICIQRRYSTRAVAWSRSIGMGGRNPRNRWLRSPECASDPLDGVAPVFFAQIQEALDAPWALAAVADLVYPETRGERPPDLDATLRSAQGIMRLSARDAEVHKLRMEVMNLPKPRSVYRDPALAARVR